jgi:hypothetical protein
MAYSRFKLECAKWEYIRGRTSSWGMLWWLAQVESTAWSDLEDVCGEQRF